jgi:hypothetical protein
MDKTAWSFSSSSLNPALKYWNKHKPLAEGRQRLGCYVTMVDRASYVECDV